ncbi:Pimeloyl-ACP methyl ester carboxylesterase [Paracoccus halophilus]|uniref:Pimeloyl-ACP methyl ester carboxylesterase n=1 Tax=Paracoccus halophilus TaxID=376733 RepID=A0A1I0U1P7_9RHOB|nr:alpha/beta hydrolase [Paracoccus halophilus]SFA58039.1 Pimeloyl-ACP methyl ester carboxylesterase [Paracoccus halophilus]
MSQKTFPAEDGAQLAYGDEGQGLPLLALAGLTRDGRDFAYLARHLRDVRLIRLDSRGRGGSEWTGAATYTVGQEARDALALMDHLGLARAAIIGSSRGGLLAMAMAASAPDRISGICFNDTGPVLEREGLLRIGGFIGIRPTVGTLQEVADRLPAAMPGFANVPAQRWVEETVRHYVQERDGVGLTYDPALRDAFELAMQANPLPDAWPLFDACAGLPLALIRGAGSDVLTHETAMAMCARRPDMLYAEIPDRGHIPFLDEPEALAVIADWLGKVRQHEAELAGAGAS